jgi:hypothetical protein
MALGFCSKADKQDRWMRYWGVRGFGTRKMANTGTELSEYLHPLSKLCMTLHSKVSLQGTDVADSCNSALINRPAGENEPSNSNLIGR